jgi:hypothetical protein
MPLLVVFFVVALVLPIGVGVLAHRRGLSVRGGPQAWGEAAAGRFGRVPGAALVFVVGMAATAVVSLGFGFLAKAIEHSVDRPVFNWVFPRVQDTVFDYLPNKFTEAQDKLTMMGSNANTQLVGVFAAIILAFAYRRRWWLPPIAIGVVYAGEKYLQRFLAKVVDRGHPPTTAGTFPSGGVGRILAVYGTIVILVILLQPRLSRGWRAGLWTGLVTAACVESFTRVYLSKHWLTDAVFGLPFGAMLLLTNVAAVCALAAVGSAPPPADRAEPAPPVREPAAH